jgi:site-specific DNA-methyltransferase (adenine-specific)
MRDFRILLGDCRDRLKELPDNSIDSIVTDPPYELGFMGKSWDASGVAYDVSVWRECLRVLKPGGHLLSFGGSRTYHRMACAIEDAGFQIRDQIMWVYGSGFPKSLNIGKALDKVAGAEREVIGTIRNNQPGGTSAFAEGGVGSYQKGDTTERDIVGGPVTPEAEVWNGWGTALKPAHEPIVLARKPLDGTVANNVLKHGVGGMNIDGCRVGDEVLPEQTAGQAQIGTFERTNMVTPERTGRFPANFIHDGSDEVLQLFPDSKGGAFPKKSNIPTGRHYEGGWGAVDNGVRTEMGEGSAARFFYCAKASKKDRNEGLDQFEEKQTFGGGSRPPDQYSEDEKYLKNAATAYGAIKAPNKNHHPTVKPTDLMRYLCRLVTPPNGTVLDPFTGSGSTGKAAVLEGFSFIGVEQSEEYIAIAEARIKSVYDSRA